MQIEFSFNDIVKLDSLELSGKIFTHDKRLAQGDLSKINEIEHANIVSLFSGLRCMKGIET